MLILLRLCIFCFFESQEDRSQWSSSGWGAEFMVWPLLLSVSRWCECSLWRVRDDSICFVNLFLFSYLWAQINWKKMFRTPGKGNHTWDLHGGFRCPGSSFELWMKLCSHAKSYVHKSEKSSLLCVNVINFLTFSKFNTLNTMLLS